MRLLKLAADQRNAWAQVGEVMRLELAPDGFDVVEFGSVFGQPLDGEPVRPRREGRERQPADVDHNLYQERMAVPLAKPRISA